MATPKANTIKTKKADVCIVGGGVAGLLAAIHCHRQQLDYLLISPDEEARGSGMGFLMHENGLACLQRTGLDWKVKQAGVMLSHCVFQMDDGTQQVVKREQGASQDLIALPRPEFLAVLQQEIPPERVVNASFESTDPTTGYLQCRRQCSNTSNDQHMDECMYEIDAKVIGKSLVIG